MWTQKTHQSSVKIQIKNKISSNEEFISDVHSNFRNTYIFLKINFN
jgi:hypothetical protein